MELTKNLTRVTALALGIAGVLAYGDVHAAAFQLKENSVKAQGRAMAGSASAKGDASVVVNNPAVMSTFTERTLQADVTAIDLSYEFSGSGTAATGTPFQQPLTGGNGGDAGDVAAVPAASFILPLSGDFEYLTLGMMISAPFGLKTEYDAGWKGRYHALESDVKIVDLTLAASLELSDSFSIGAGLIYEHADVTLSNAIDFGTIICAQNPTACLVPNSPFGPQRNDGIAHINGTDNGLGWIIGMNWRPTDKLSLGYSHRSEIDHELDGKGDFTVPAAARAGQQPPGRPGSPAVRRRRRRRQADHAGGRRVQCDLLRHRPLHGHGRSHPHRMELPAGDPHRVRQPRAAGFGRRLQLGRELVLFDRWRVQVQ